MPVNTASPEHWWTKEDAARAEEARRQRSQQAPQQQPLGSSTSGGGGGSGGSPSGPPPPQHPPPAASSSPCVSSGTSPQACSDDAAIAAVLQLQQDEAFLKRLRGTSKRLAGLSHENLHQEDGTRLPPGWISLRCDRYSPASQGTSSTWCYTNPDTWASQAAPPQATTSDPVGDQVLSTGLATSHPIAVALVVSQADAGQVQQ